MNKQIINEKSLPFSPFSPSPTGGKSALNLGQGFTPQGKVPTESQAQYSHWGKV